MAGKIGIRASCRGETAKPPLAALGFLLELVGRILKDLAMKNIAAIA
jgi:hypothetical protein